MKKRVADIIMDTLVEYGITDCFAVIIISTSLVATPKDMNNLKCSIKILADKLIASSILIVPLVQISKVN